MILKLKKIIFTTAKVPLFFEDVDIDDILVSNKIYVTEKSCEHFIG